MPSCKRCPDALIAALPRLQRGMPRCGKWLRGWWWALRLWWRFKCGLAPPGLAHLLRLPLENATRSNDTPPPVPPPGDDAPVR